MITGPTPLHYFSAPSQGTGKSLLAEILAMIFDPDVATMNFDNSKNASTEALEQSLFSVQNSKSAHCFFDNVKWHVDSSALEQAITSGGTGKRILHTQKTKKVNNRCVWIITGNGCSFSKDLLRRLIEIRIDRKVANPAEVAWNFEIDDIKTYVQKERRKLVMAVLTVIEYWKSQGSQRAKKVPHIGSFESWASIIGGILESVGYMNLLQNREDTKRRGTDPLEFKWNEFYELWYGKHPNEWVQASALEQLMIDSGLNDALFPSKKATPQGIGVSLQRRIETTNDTSSGYKIESFSKYVSSSRSYIIHKPDETPPPPPKK